MDAAVVAGAGDVESVSASGTAASRLPSSRSFPPGRPPPLSSLLLFLFVVISVVGQVWALWAYRSKINTRVLEYFLNIFLTSVFVKMYCRVIFRINK